MREIRYFYILFLLVFFNILGNAQCGISDTLIQIPDNEKGIGLQLLIDGYAINDLSDPNQGVCGVTLNYVHPQRAQLTIELVSPYGQKIMLVGPFDPFYSRLTGNKEWDISFVPCSNIALPDPGKKSIFNNKDKWQFGSNFSGSYYPNNGCLEDFNVGPVNGTWTFVVYDHKEIFKGSLLGFSIEFCDGSSVDCNLCEANAGFFAETELQFCANDPQIDFNLDHEFYDKAPDTNFYNFNYIIFKDNNLIKVSDTVDIDFKDIGKYEICGLSYAKVDSNNIFNLFNSVDVNKFVDSIKAIESPFCAQITDTCKVIEILPVANLVSIDTAICLGDTFHIAGENFFESGDYYIASTIDKCNTAYNLKLSVLELDASIIANNTQLKCLDSELVIKGQGFVPGSKMAFKWLEPLVTYALDPTEVVIGKAGVYHFVLSLGECSDTAQIIITSDIDIPILEFELQDINCDRDTAMLKVSSTNSVLDSVNWNNGIVEYIGATIKTNKEGSYLVQAFSDKGCKSFEIIDVIIDTLVPNAYISKQDITCGNDTGKIFFNSSDDLREIYWLELNSNIKDPIVFKGGTYNVLYTATNGCSKLDSIQIFENTDTLVYSIKADSIDCRYIPVNIDFNSLENNLNFEWITPLNDTFYTEDITANIDGFYKYTIINEFDCVTQDSFEVILDDDIPEITFNKDTLFLSCGDSIQLFPNVTGIISTFKWFGPGDYSSDSLNPFVHIAGEYFLEIEATNSCTQTASIVVKNDNTVPDITIFNDTINCIDNIANLNIKYNGNYSFLWKDPFNLTHTGSSLSSFANGYFYLTVTDLNNNCKSEFVTFVPLDTLRPSINIVKSNNLDCKNDSLICTVNSNTTLKSIHWRTENGNDFYGDSLIVKNIGKYYITIESTGNCETSSSFEITDEEILEIAPDTFYLTCTDKFAKLNLDIDSTKFEFNWTGNNYSSNFAIPVVNEEGIYKVTVSNGNCIDSTEILVIDDSEAPTAEISFDKFIECIPNYSILRAKILTGDISLYSWSGKNYLSETLIDTIYKEGKYNFTLDSKNGCTTIYTVDVFKSDDYPDIEVIGDTINCIDPKHDLIINAKIQGDYNFIQWTGPNGYISNSLKNSKVEIGKYYLRVENDKGCVSEDSTSIIIDTVPPNISTSPIQTITCYFDTLDLILETDANNPLYHVKGPYGYESNDKISRIVNGGNYYLKIIGENGCYVEDTIDVPINKLKPYALIQSEDLNCCESIKLLTVNSSAEVFNATWTYPDSTKSNKKSISIIDSGYYHVEIFDVQNGCTEIDSVFVNWDSIRPTIISHDYYLPCDGSDIELFAYSNAEVSEFVWFGPNGYYEEGEKVKTNIPGKYTIYATGVNCCIKDTFINVYDIPVYPEFKAYGSDINCYKDSTTLKAIGVKDVKSFQWNGPNGFVSFLEEPTIYLPGDYTLSLIGNNGCDTSITVQVISDTVKPQIVFNFEDSLICDKQTGFINAEILNKDEVLYSFLWSTNNGALEQGIYTANPLIRGEGIYTLKVKNTKNGCFAIDSISINNYSYSLDSIDFTITNPSCLGFGDGVIAIDTVYGGTPPFSFSFDNFWFSNVDSFSSKQTGNYNFYIKDKFGCKLDTNIVVPDGGDVQLKLGVINNNIFVGDSVIVQAIIIADNGIKEYEWEPENLFDNQDDSIQIIRPPKSVNISLKVIDNNGCFSDDIIWIEVKSKPDVFIPNIFSPDLDGINDYFYMKSGSGIKSINRLLIYNRWGDLIFDKENLRQNVPIDGWDGKFNGNLVSSGVYVYSFILELEDGSIESISGDITVIR